jgi:ribonuclease HII
MTLKHFYLNQNEVGLDEAGRGPLLGRVYAGAVIWDPSKEKDKDKVCEFINDSKKLTPKKRKLALQWIKENLIWSYGYADVEEIEQHNILNATKIAMDRAINKIKKMNIDIKDIIIDGTGWEKKFDNTYTIKSIIKGDANYYSIACASIIAKEYHDEHILELCKECPDLDHNYNISNNMGYPTKDHIDGINKYGITKYHRHTFNPCNKHIKPEN